jgi:hypothetical protein
MFTTGFPQLDSVLHNILPGDNLVFEVNEVSEYLHFVQPFVETALQNKMRVVYFRFAEHEELVPHQEGVVYITLDPNIGFEKFVSTLVDIIEETGNTAWYVFDCLSGLAYAWYSDRMLANFFLLVCPFVLKIKSLAYFSIYKSQHSSHFTDSLYSTAQIIIEVYSYKGNLYIQPKRVENRHSPTMYMLHVQEEMSFLPVTNSATTADVVGTMRRPLLNFTIQRFGVWTQFYHDAQTVLQALEKGEKPTADVQQLFERLLKMIITRQKPFLSLAREFFDLSFLIDIMKRLIGSGLIGGKARGILLAQRILERADPRWAEILERHDSFYIGSDVFYTYIVQNDCWGLRRKKGTIEEIIDRAKIARDRIMEGEFLDYFLVQFQEMLEYFGQSPIIVRSSSLQEDSYGNSFSGKYESIFCANQGTPEERLEEFLDAVRRVYASSMDEDALMYRLHHGLLYEDEQMALLVQRVSGDRYGDYFFPAAAGVGFSYNPYVWDTSIDPYAGMLRLAFGLGTRAVDRVEDDYTRIVALNAPERRPEKNPEESKKYTQKDVDLVDLKKNTFGTVPIKKVFPQVKEKTLSYFTELDEEMMERAKELASTDVLPWRLSFKGLFTRTDFTQRMREMLKTLEKAYKSPVDIEFTVNLQDDSTYRVNLVQCRPFKVRLMKTGDIVDPPENIPPENIVMESDGPIVGQSLATEIDRLIYVSPLAYTQLSGQDRYAVARLIGRITRQPESGRQIIIMLVGPGRWGTSTPAMGVPVTFKEIKSVSIIVELAVMHEGLVPDVSLGTHFFNDLVEMDMLYFAVFPERKGNSFNQKFFSSGRKNLLPELFPDEARWSDTVMVLDNLSEKNHPAIYLHADSMKQHAICYLR